MSHLRDRVGTRIGEVVFVCHVISIKSWDETRADCECIKMQLKVDTNNPQEFPTAFGPV